MKEGRGNELLSSVIGGIYFNPTAKHRTGLSVRSDCFYEAGNAQIMEKKKKTLFMTVIKSLGL